MPRFRLVPWLRSSYARAAGRLTPAFPGLSDEQIERLLADIDATLADMRHMTRTHAGPNILMRERLAARGADVDAVARAAPSLIATLEATCDTCAHWRRCARDLARSPSRTDGEDYCPNSPHIDGIEPRRRGEPTSGC